MAGIGMNIIRSIARPKSPRGELSSVFLLSEVRTRCRLGKMIVVVVVVVECYCFLIIIIVGPPEPYGLRLASAPCSFST